MMSTAPQRLLHITHARQDEAWVEGVLLPALGLTEGQYWTRAEDDLGAPRLDELDRAVLSCRYTLLVASSAGRVDEWNQFIGQLAQHLGIEEGKPRLLLVARDFVPGSERAHEILPLHQRCLACFDCSDPERTTASLAALAAQLALTTTEAPPAECPYPGLRMFGAGDPASCFNRPDLFFGRDDEGRDIVDRLRRGGRVLLIGPSGCGKSSLMRARVLPALGQGDDAMTIAVVRPGRRPEVALLDALDALDRRLGPAIDAYLDADDEPAARQRLVAAAAGPRRLLCLDQLEEVFLDQADEAGERARFFARLAALGRVPGIAILLGMRADFYGDLMRSPAWDELKDHRVELAPLRGPALRQAITRPAELAGVHVEVDLVERLVREADVDRAAEALPLLQVALEQLWALREWRYLSLASYARIAEGQRNGLDVVLTRHADTSIAALDEPLQALARRVLIDLVHLGEGRPDTRRRRLVSELRRAGDDGHTLAQILDHLSAQRLITISAEASVVAAVQTVAFPVARADGTDADALAACDGAAARHVDLAHDTLITGWPALAGWISERRDKLRTQRRLEARAVGGVLDATELPEFVRWLRWVDTPDGQALGASVALRTLVWRSEAARTWRLAGLVAFMGALAVAAGIAWWQRGIANQQRRQAEQRLALNEQERAKSLIVDGQDPIDAVQHLVQAVKLGVDSTVLRTLLVETKYGLWRTAVRHGGAVNTAVFSIDGTRIVTASTDGTARVWDATTGAPVGLPLKHDGEIWSAVFSADGTRVLTASADRTARVWDATTGAPLSVPLKHVGEVLSAAFSADGTRVVTASRDHTAQVWDATTGAPLGVPLEHDGSVWSAVFSADGTRVVTASRDHTARVWDATTGAPLGVPLQHNGAVLSAVFSADGTRVVTADDDGTARVWDATTGAPLGVPLEHDGSVWSAVFSADGTRVVTASNGATARVWDTTTGAPVGVPLKHDGAVRSAVFSADGTRVVTASWDHTARVWDATSGAPLGAPLKHDEAVLSAVFSADGTRVVTASRDHTARVWDATTEAPLGVPLKHDGAVRSAVFSADGTRVVTASDDHTARVWDATTGAPLGVSFKHDGLVKSAVFSADGTRVVTAGKDGTAKVWDATTGAPLGVSLKHDVWVWSAVFSADGTRVATASVDGTARVWDVAQTGALSAWIEQAAKCVVPGLDAVGSSAVCPLADRKSTPTDLLARARALIAVADRATFTHVWPLSRIDYRRASQALDGTRGLVAGADERDAEELKQAVSIRLAILDGLEGRLQEARTRLGADAPGTDALLLNALGGAAHDELRNDDVALPLLLRAHELDPGNVDILANLAEGYFAVGQYENFARTAHKLDTLAASPDVRLAVAALAWAAARLTRTPDAAQQARLLRTYKEIASGTRPVWSWKGTTGVLAYGRHRIDDVKPILDVLALLEEEVTDETRARLATLLLGTGQTRAEPHER